ncbi:unnamed protein product [Lymnaea stagnalis]|uniref:Uncharacterized protein n=1 Tax=Lymnaea stagnalis TaxID=6523 RepID=A0AAV2HQN6_LYMST
METGHPLKLAYLIVNWMRRKKAYRSTRMKTIRPLELAYLTEKWMRCQKIKGTYDYVKLKLSMWNLTWNDILRTSDPSMEIMALKETVLLARERSPLLVGEPECKVQLYSGLLKYGNTGFNQNVKLSFEDLPDYILNYLSIKSLNLDLGREVTETDPSPYLLNPKPIQHDSEDAGPVWRGCYVAVFTLRANLSGDVKVNEDLGSVQQENLKEIVRCLKSSKKTDYILLTSKGCEWIVTGRCEFNLYS